MRVLHSLFLMRTITNLATLMPLTHYAIQLPGQVKHLFYAPLEPTATTVTTIFTPPPVCLAHLLAKPSTLKASLTLYFSLSVRSSPHSVRSFGIYQRPANYHSLLFPSFPSFTALQIAWAIYLKDRAGWGWSLTHGLSEGCAFSGSRLLGAC